MSGRKKRAEEASSHERWLITYADLVTLLFALFIVLFANSNLDEGKFGRTAEAIRAAFDLGLFGGSGEHDSLLTDGGGGLLPEARSRERQMEIVSEGLRETAQRLGIPDQVTVTQTPDGLIVSLSNHLLFGPASADVNPRAAPFLLSLARSLAAIPNEIRVEGHTDSIPVAAAAFASNWELSTARATAVLRLLVEEGGVPPARIHAAGFADQRPVADNATPDGRARNRRADIVILYPTQEDAGAAAAEPE